MENSLSPFFIVGCVRSGTTLLRDLLRLHANLACPEETHYFRWDDPFGTEAFQNRTMRSSLLMKHRGIDGITEQQMEDLFVVANSRGELLEMYMNRYLRAIGKTGARWFDKTPQHVYGLMLLSSYFPNAKFISIHRDPLNVVASMKTGAVVKVNVKGAVNYWRESLIIVNQFKAAWPDKLHEVSYRELTTSPKKILKKILRYVGESDQEIEIPRGYVHREKNHYKKILTAEEISYVKEQCASLMSHYGYL